MEEVEGRRGNKFEEQFEKETIQELAKSHTNYSSRNFSFFKNCNGSLFFLKALKKKTQIYLLFKENWKL